VKFYNRYYQSSFEELLSYYPRFYRDVYEMVAILQAQGRLLDGLETNIEQTFLNNFILTADAATIKTWENILGITYKKPLTLDQRKHVVIGRISGYGHIGEPEIRALIANYTDKPVTVDFMRGILSIVITGEVFDEANLLDTLLRRIPAHLGLKMSIHIRKQYRQTIPFSQGGAVGSYFFLEPVTQEHISTTLPVPVSQAGADSTRLTSAPPTPEKTARMRYKLWQGGTSTSDMAGDTPQVQETARKHVSVAQGAFDRPEIDTDTPEVKEASTSQGKAAGGLFCHTHIKSKRIE